jgi:hypothetical protein
MVRALLLPILLTGLVLAGARAEMQPPTPEAHTSANPTPDVAADSQTSQSICLMIESAARANGLPVEFFARVIWQESRFEAAAVGPRTRTGERAQGIAQFMPRTAIERGLLDPFDPVQALPKSAEFLRDLRAEFGNLGLAAAAYNAGPQRVRDYLAGRGGMPGETRSYVAAVTGASVDDWIVAGHADHAPASTPSCRALVAMLKRAPNPFVQELEQRVALVAAAPWGVQLSAGFSRTLALSDYARIAKRHEELFQGRDVSILTTRLLSRGTRMFYQVRVGANTRVAAQDLCTNIRLAGGACLVLRNRS